MAGNCRFIHGLHRTNWDCDLRMADSLALAAKRRLLPKQLSDEHICEQCYVGVGGLHCNHRMLLGCVGTYKTQA